MTAPTVDHALEAHQRICAAASVLNALCDGTLEPGPSTFDHLCDLLASAGLHLALASFERAVAA